MLLLLIISSYLLLFSSIETKVNCTLMIAQEELEPFLITQAYLVEAYQNYVDWEKHRLNEIKRRLQSYISRGAKPPEEIIYNPINSFLLIRGLSSELSELMELAYQTKNSENHVNGKIATIKNNLKFPDEADYLDMIDGINRVKDFYLVETKHMANGYLLGNKPGSLSLTVDDLFELGLQNFKHGHFQNAIDWLNEALHRYHVEIQRGNIAEKKAIVKVSLVTILEYLAAANYEVNEMSNDLNLELNENLGRGERQGQYEKGESKPIYSESHLKWLCRGEGNNKVEQKERRKCQYVSNGNAYLLLGPVKQEQISFNPNIYVFHEVIFDWESYVIREVAKAVSKRENEDEAVIGEEMGQSGTGELSWLEENGLDKLVLEKIFKRMKAITGYEVGEDWEEFSVTNYKVGKHYEWHYDFYNDEENFGRRVATYLFYLSEVEAGGATVFPTLNLTLWPRKGSAVFWHNVDENGENDKNTFHGPCAVALGSKWVATKWIYDRGQKFTRISNLKKNKLYKIAAKF